MKTRLFVLGLLAVCTAMIPLSHLAMSGPKGKGPAPKVAICHFPDDQAVGHVIEVSENAVAAHLAKHGDCTAFAIVDTTGCRCLTCLELCERNLERCLADCGDNSPCRGACRGSESRCRSRCTRLATL